MACKIGEEQNHVKKQKNQRNGLSQGIGKERCEKLWIGSEVNFKVRLISAKGKQRNVERKIG